MKSILTIEFMTGTIVEAATVEDGFNFIKAYMDTLPATDEEKERYNQEFAEKLIGAIFEDKDTIEFEPFFRMTRHV